MAARFDVRIATIQMRQGEFAPQDEYLQGDIRWIRLTAVWQSRRRFGSVTILQFEDILKANTDRGRARYRFVNYGGDLWVSCIDRAVRRAGPRNVAAAVIAAPLPDAAPQAEPRWV